ncbi:ankyrin repeat-containing domain protein [Melanogaster broomeanus]|nr:ankyrin repeat-containing domain protein [Melanogaster broomeanus]
MSNDDERRTLNLYDKRLLAAARQGDVEEVLDDPECSDPNSTDDFLFDINCIDVLGNTPLHLAVSSGSAESVELLLEVDGCDVDPQNFEGDTPLHLAVQIQDPDARQAIVSLLVEDAGAVDSIKLTNKAGQTPKALCDIYCPDDDVVAFLTTPAVRTLAANIDADDIASDGEGGSGYESE